jgi:hypothetical protein
MLKLYIKKKKYKSKSKFNQQRSIETIPAVYFVLPLIYV